MNKLKSYLSTLIEACFGKKKAFIAQQAMPSTQFEVIEPAAGLNQTFTATKDGWLYVSGRGSSEQASSIEVVYSNITFGTRIFVNGAFLLRTFIPMRKGSSVSIGFQYVETDRLIRFVSSIGGGA